MGVEEGNAASLAQEQKQTNFAMQLHQGGAPVNLQSYSQGLHCQS